MTRKKLPTPAWLLVLLLTGCASWDRGCSSCSAQTFGGDWIVVQYRTDGTPINCWQLRNTSVANETHSDGIFWKSPNGHLVHISGWYNRVQVVGTFESAAKEVGIDLQGCPGGKYLLPEKKPDDKKPDDKKPDDKKPDDKKPDVKKPDDKK